MRLFTPSGVDDSYLSDDSCFRVRGTVCVCVCKWAVQLNGIEDSWVWVYEHVCIFPLCNRLTTHGALLGNSLWHHHVPPRRVPVFWQTALLMVCVCVCVCVCICACIWICVCVWVSINVLLLPLYAINSVCHPFTHTDINTDPHVAVIFHLLCTHHIIHHLPSIRP